MKCNRCNDEAPPLETFDEWSCSCRKLREQFLGMQYHEEAWCWMDRFLKANNYSWEDQKQIWLLVMNNIPEPPK